MSRSIKNAVVVVTGASSGIGRATARAFAAQGARLVLAARREAALRETCRECEALGAPTAIAVPTDVSDAAAVERLADRAVEAFGRIDVWVNGAAVLLMSRFAETPLELFRRVVDVNLLGYVHGSNAAIRRFRARGRGTLINIGSVLGLIGVPYASAYVATKFAIRGLTQCVRQEMRREAPGIDVCLVMPGPIDTPVYHHAANLLPWRLKALDPVNDPSRVAREVVRLAKAPRPETTVGFLGPLTLLGVRTLPRLSEHLIRWIVPKLQFENTGRAPRLPRHGNLMQPIDDAMTTRGGWWERSTRPKLIAAAGIGLLAVAGTAWLRRSPSVDRTVRRDRLGP